MRIGILGGGQLAMMMIKMSSNKHNIDFLVVDPSENPPASKYAKCIKSEYDDIKSLDLLIKNCDVITIDFENVPSHSLEYLEKHIPVHPNSKSVEICQDRLNEKNIFLQNNILTTKFKSVESEKDLKKAIEEFGPNSILKSRKLGYDGKNQIIIGNQDTKDIWAKIAGVESIIENKIDFITEVSIIGVRNILGETFFYPLVENFHKNGILNISIAPFENDNIQKEAEKIHEKITNAMNYVGVLVIEFFIDKNNKLIANEMAPRVHNSGHWTISGANVSQFESHILAISNLPLKKIKTTGYSGMLNILSKMPDINKIKEIGISDVFNYDKSERPNRKLGHITITCPTKKLLLEKIDVISKMLC
tara:strand:- start:1742 stop:2827 length:1086 start_codon:yes stop_codon:yes gene_type:complete